MSSQVEICNLALSHLGIAKEIANLETDRGQEASALRRFYDISLDHTLRDAEWPWATKSATLNLVEADPTTEWAYSYRYPTDCLFIRRIFSGIRNETRQSRIPYRIVRDTTARLIYTDESAPVCEYTMRLDDPDFYPSDFVMAFSLRLSYQIAPRLTAGDPFGLTEKVFALYQREINNAQNSAFNEEQAEELVQSEFIRIRE